MISNAFLIITENCTNKCVYCFEKHNDFNMTKNHYVFYLMMKEHKKYILTFIIIFIIINEMFNK